LAIAAARSSVPFQIGRDAGGAEAVIADRRHDAAGGGAPFAKHWPGGGGVPLSRLVPRSIVWNSGALLGEAAAVDIGVETFLESVAARISCRLPPFSYSWNCSHSRRF